MCTQNGFYEKEDVKVLTAWRKLLVREKVDTRIVFLFNTSGQHRFFKDSHDYLIFSADAVRNSLGACHEWK